MFPFGLVSFLNKSVEITSKTFTREAKFVT